MNNNKHTEGIKAALQRMSDLSYAAALNVTTKDFLGKEERMNKVLEEFSYLFQQPTVEQERDIEQLAKAAFKKRFPVFEEKDSFLEEGFIYGYKANTVNKELQEKYNILLDRFTKLQAPHEVNKELLFSAQNAKTEIEWWLKEFKGLTNDDIAMMKMCVESLQVAIKKAEQLKQ